jgi:hypothetical protein
MQSRTRDARCRTWDMSDPDQKRISADKPDPIRFLPRPTSHVHSRSTTACKGQGRALEGSPIVPAPRALAK